MYRAGLSATATDTAAAIDRGCDDGRGTDCNGADAGCEFRRNPIKKSEVDDGRETFIFHFQ
jgi:hypothetical protein